MCAHGWAGGQCVQAGLRTGTRSPSLSASRMQEKEPSPAHLIETKSSAFGLIESSLIVIYTQVWTGCAIAGFLPTTLTVPTD